MLIAATPSEIGAQLWMLGTAAYPMYLVRGHREGALIEGGVSALGPLLKQQLHALGIGPQYIRQAVITHAHPDHVMAIPALREMFPDLSVLASATAAATLTSEKALGFFRQIDGALAEALHRCGAIAEAEGAAADLSSSATENTAGQASSGTPAKAPDRIAVDRVVGEGDVLSVEDLSWTVLATPGHSDCSISLHEASRRLLIISDASGYYLPASNTWWPNYFSGYAAYLKSLERLAALDAEVLGLSHNGAVLGRDDVRAYFAGAIAATQQYHERIVAAAKDGKPVRQLAEELGAEIHRQTPLLPLDFFQKNCGLLIKQSLKHAAS
jgi:glyoxylase-like metal-dependent hydrolase (beta-lactamase superfamily II)